VTLNQLADRLMACGCDPLCVQCETLVLDFKRELLVHMTPDDVDEGQYLEGRTIFREDEEN